jgi:hypothetical protein
LLTAGRYEPSSEYPGLKQITLGLSELDLKKLKNYKRRGELDYRGLTNIMEISTNDYKEAYEKYKNAAKEYNIDLFFCDIFVNDVCIDVANHLRIPVVTFTTLLYCNYK